ncbi:hypothetical protein LR48_Vigan10g234800 [Vigna angularis]|uniref:Uncharacterized protein n=1 Tax=Phaseolus angularis TaxID=3914 RepID=A0A0L9VN36_PHAAN|nr:hypothetical protein LR48_Vigan10g234800 [Vigna angularis]
MMPIRDDVVKVHLGVDGFNRLLVFQSFQRNPLLQTMQKQLLFSCHPSRAIQAAGSEIGETTLRQMGFVARGNIFVHKDEAYNDDEDDDIDAHMIEPVNVVDPSKAALLAAPSSSSFSIEEHLANFTRQMEQMRNFQEQMSTLH